MEVMAPVSTEEASCQDCYRCLRACPVKAIRVSGGSAQVRPEACIACGRCVTVCPAKAKRVRDDLPRVRALLGNGKRVVCSLAPSWVAEFPGLEPGRMVAALRALGFAAVSQTAVGARAVSRAAVAEQAAAPQALLLSTACPAARGFVQRHRPALAPALSGLLSPALVHARMLQEAGLADAVVLVSPCIAKKSEADEHPGLLSAALTFQELRRWFAVGGVDPRELTPGADDRFTLDSPGDGVLYPVEGGMLTGMRGGGGDAEGRLVSASGISDLDLALAGLDPAGCGLFVEMLACPGGCVNGPGMTVGEGLLRRRGRIVAQPRGPDGAPLPAVDARGGWAAQPDLPPPASESELTAALTGIGKRSPEDELNCGGCGYETCRDLARALVAQRAEPVMCVSYMRRLAQRKASALLAAMPAGAVLVDERLAVVECNRNFALLVGAEERFAASGLAGEPVSELVPFARLFRHVLDGGGEVLDRDLPCGKRVLHGAVFTVEPRRLAGAVLVDATAPAMSRAQVAERAKQAIESHLATVQRIAFLLGENAAETETLLNAIVDAHEVGNDGPAA